MSYREAFERELGLRSARSQRSSRCARWRSRARARRAALAARCERDELLDWLMAQRSVRAWAASGLCFVHRYPASQAALARLDPDDPRVALRFELYYRGVELANGFEELADAAEQRARFEADQRERRRRGLPAAGDR